MSSGVQIYLCGGIISNSMCNSYIYGIFCDLCVYSFSCEFFCKFEKILMNFFSKYFHVYNIILPKILEFIEVIDTTSIAKQNNTKI